MHPLVASYLRFNRLQAVGNVLALSFAVMALVMLAQISRNVGDERYAVRAVGWLTVQVVLWLLLLASGLFLLVGRYSQVRERTQELGVLRMLGASTAYIFDLLCQETAVLAVPGTVLGILLAYAGRLLIEASFADLFFFRRALEWWPLACLITATVSLTGGMMAVWMVSRIDVTEAMGHEE